MGALPYTIALIRPRYLVLAVQFSSTFAYQNGGLTLASWFPILYDRPAYTEGSEEFLAWQAKDAYAPSKHLRASSP